jgi:pyruvate formate lyase activating enzyme
MLHNSPLQFDTRGLEKFSLVEWPGKMAAIIFTGGCNFRCPFCHNPELIDINHENVPPAYPWEEIDKFLEKKKGWIDAIMITGGEPTIHPDLPKVLKKIKEKGFSVGVATNGGNPEMLSDIIKNKLVDRICLDIKGSPNKYPLAIGKNDYDIAPIKKSVDSVINGSVPYELRITIVPGITEKEDILEIGEFIKGAKKIVLQQFRPLKTLDKSYQSKVPYCKDEIIEMAKELEKYVEEVNLDFIE